MRSIRATAEPAFGKTVGQSLKAKTVGAAFVVLGLISWARGHTVVPRVLWTLGTLLVVPGLVAPALLGPVQRVWMRAAGVLGHVSTRVILSLLFYLG